ncbi:MAG: 50S ribosomal protein L9 [Lachnospiraceae bacterium]|nr:50S ribosomal protein L9 [Lachnospiraceae bacterium]MBQ2405835.1 50S ribosomal protein L9 [Lachnospiraceae bacterium]MBQ5851740.1 50S ribosomal protein L9 [Lachnospiraceae bacterium]MEE0919356.1 50S ribosomal protein L9 [Lachnospiraceae bacterium]
MKIILLEDVKSVGKKGELVELKEGYAKNFILPKKLGVEATGANLNNLKLQKQNEEKVAKQQLEAAQALAAELEELTVELNIKGGEGGKTFGSVSSKEIAVALSAQFGKDIDKKKIQMQEAIKSAGYHNVTVKLHPKVSCTLKVHVGLQEKK